MSGIEQLGRMAALLDRSVVAGMLIILILIVRMLRARVPKHTFAALWCVVLIRLLCPYTLEVPFSLFSIFGRTRMEMVRAVADQINRSARVLYVSVPFGAHTASGEPVVSVTPVRLIWTIGFLLCITYFVCTAVRAGKRLKGADASEDPRLSSFAKQHHGRIAVRASDQLHAPLVRGVLRPALVLPQSVLDTGGDALAYVLTYASIHVRGGYALLRALLVLSVCVHWFNPLCWVMLVIMNRDMELLCDALTVRRCGEAARSAYRALLLQMEEPRSRLLPLANGFSRGALEERVSALMMRPYASVAGQIAGVVLVALAATSMTGTAPAGVKPPVMEVMEVQENAVGESLTGEDTTWTVGEEVAQGFYVVSGTANATLTLENQSGRLFYHMEAILERAGERKFVIYLADGTRVRFEGKSLLTPITHGKVISDKTATVYIGSGLFRAGASIPVGVYSVSAAPGMGMGTCLIYEVSADGKTTTEVQRIPLREMKTTAIQLQEGQILEIRSAMLECNG